MDERKNKIASEWERNWEIKGKWTEGWVSMREKFWLFFLVFETSEENFFSLKIKEFERIEDIWMEEEIKIFNILDSRNDRPSSVQVRSVQFRWKIFKKKINFKKLKEKCFNFAQFCFIQFFQWNFISSKFIMLQLCSALLKLIWSILIYSYQFNLI